MVESPGFVELDSYIVVFVRGTINTIQSNAMLCNAMRIEICTIYTIAMHFALFLHGDYINKLGYTLSFNSGKIKPFPFISGNSLEKGLKFDFP